MTTISPATLRGPRTLREKIGQVLMVSFSGTSMTADTAHLIDTFAIGSVILFARNAAGPIGSVHTLLSDLQRAARFPLLVATDQEGGTVIRVRHGITVFPSAATYGERGSPLQVYNDATITAHELRALGLTMNLAPVVDVLSNPRSPIGTRSYGTAPHLVAQLSAAAIRGYQEHGLAACAKHFIGLGHTSIDSHDTLPTVRLTLNELEGLDLIPFRSAIAAGVSAMLVAHVALPEIDAANRPASLSPVIIDGVIRRHLGFTGVVMTDSLLMGALPAGQEPEAAERALAAGADILLFGWNQDLPVGVIATAVERIEQAILHGRIPEQRLNDAVARILAHKQRYRPVL